MTITHRKKKPPTHRHTVTHTHKVQITDECHNMIYILWYCIYISYMSHNINNDNNNG